MAALWSLRVVATLCGVAFASVLWASSASAESGSSGLDSVLGQTTKAVTHTASQATKPVSRPVQRAVRTATKAPVVRAARPVTRPVVRTARAVQPRTVQSRPQATRPAPQRTVTKVTQPARRQTSAEHEKAKTAAQPKATQHKAAHHQATPAKVGSAKAGSAKASTAQAGSLSSTLLLDRLPALPVTGPVLDLADTATTSLVADLPPVLQPVLVGATSTTSTLLGGTVDRVLPVVADVTADLPVVGGPLPSPLPATGTPSDFGPLAHPVVRPAATASRSAGHEPVASSATPRTADLAVTRQVVTTVVTAALTRAVPDGAALRTSDDRAAAGLGTGLVLAGAAAAASGTASAGSAGWAGLAVLVEWFVGLRAVASLRRGSGRPAASRLFRQPGFSPD